MVYLNLFLPPLMLFLKLFSFLSSIDFIKFVFSAPLFFLLDCKLYILKLFLVIILKIFNIIPEGKSKENQYFYLSLKIRIQKTLSLSILLLFYLILFIYLLDIWRPYFVKWLFKSFAHFVIELSMFYLFDW